MLNTKLGELYMVPIWGLCELRSIHRENILNEDLLLYEFTPLDERHTVKMTEQRIKECGLRKLMSPDQMQGAGSKPAANLVANGGERRTQTLELLRSGRPGARRAILKGLSRLQKDGVRLYPWERELQQRLLRNVRREKSQVLGPSFHDEERGIQNDL